MAYNLRRILAIVVAFGVLQAAVAEAAPPANPPEASSQGSLDSGSWSPTYRRNAPPPRQPSDNVRNSERSRLASKSQANPQATPEEVQRPPANAGTRLQGPSGEANFD